MLTRQLARTAWLCAVLLVVFLPSLSPASYSSKKVQARAAFDKAEQLRLQLADRPESRLRPADYLAVIRAYERALSLGPSTAVGPESLAAIARLWSEMADVFGEPKYALTAAGRYELLIKEYPQNKLVPEARRALPGLQNFDRKANAKANAPVSSPATRPSAPAAESPAAAPAANLSSPGPRETEIPRLGDDPQAVMQPPVTPIEQRPPGRIAQVTSIRHWATQNYTRVVIEMDAPVEYQAGRVMNPDRIFFDLHGARLSPALRHQTIAGDDNLLKRVRVAQNQSGIARVVLEVGQIRDYSAFLLPNPYRLVVDINGMRAERNVQSARDSKPAAGSSKAPERVETAEAKTPPRDREAQNRGAQGRDSKSPAAESKPAEKTQRSAANGAEGAAKSAEQSAMEPASEKIDIASVASATAVGSQPVFERVAPRSEKNAKPAPPAESRKTAPSDAPPSSTARMAKPTSNGDRSLTRVLGLKIGTIVIDAGHGGHDTGTIGPGGLTEKELVLDVARRLGAMVEDRLGGEVVYTRSDDTFVPLETRTAIANQKQADLFVSIHANSSRDRAARGIETYYLNFTTAQDALEVAARENAVSEKSVHELQDLVKKITLRDKLEESREFASEVQRSLYTTMARGNAGLRNRGVKKAPFVVLIGANMPSILAEISFVSNPTDEKLLRKPDYRQKVAEALYRGIQRYANSLSGVKVAAHRPAPTP